MSVNSLTPESVQINLTAPESQDAPVKPRVGVALGGGSARGYAHIGALASLERHNMTPDVITGTSFGAVIGAMYASGQSVDDMIREATEMRRRDIVPHITDFGLHRGALFSGVRLESYFDRLFEGRDFKDLTRELVIVATDVDTGECVLINEGSLAKALRASASMPGIFAPVELNGRRLIDGGLAAPVPVTTLQGLDVDIAIGIGAGMEGQDSGAIRLTRQLLETPAGSHLHRMMRDSSRTNVFARLGKALAHTMSSWQQGDTDEDALHVHTRPPISWLHFHRAEYAIAAGEKALEGFMPTILQAVAKFKLA